MIHYHGTPFGGTKTDAVRFLSGRHALVPFSYPNDVEIVAEFCRTFVFDNGAFSSWKSGKLVNFEAYIKWVEKFNNHPGFDWAIIPDVIDGTEQENDELIADWPRHLRGSPVYHLNESLEKAKKLSEEFDTVCIGSSGEWPSPGSRSWWRRFSEVMQVMCDKDGNPKCRIHGLRMMDPAIFTRAPFRSVDSTNCSQNASRNGAAIDEKLARWQGGCITAWRVEAHNSPSRWRSGESFLVREKQKDLWQDE